MSNQKPNSELRRRMLEDMAVRKFSDATIRNYIRHIAEFAKFLGRAPDTDATPPNSRARSAPGPGACWSRALIEEKT